MISKAMAYFNRPVVIEFKTRHERDNFCMGVGVAIGVVLAAGMFMIAEPLLRRKPLAPIITSSLSQDLCAVRVSLAEMKGATDALVARAKR